MLEDAVAESWDFAARMYLSWITDHPERLADAADLIRHAAVADRRRAQLARQHGAPIPTTLVISPTTRCNMRCAGCGATDRGGELRDLPAEVLEQVLQECRELGICRVALIGGEPLLREELDELLLGNPGLLFFIFTNGRSLDGARARRFAGAGNLIFLVNASSTNLRTPATHVEAHVLRALEEMGRQGLLYGYSATVTALNRALFCAPDTLDQLRDRGARCGIYFDYLPHLGAADHALERALMVDAPARDAFVRGVRDHAGSLEFFTLFAPEDEALMGGCAAAGRQLLHLGAGGTIDPCPFVPCSPFSAPQNTLLEALTSDYFAELRQRALRWEVLEGACACRAAGDEFMELAAQHGAALR